MVGRLFREQKKAGSIPVTSTNAGMVQWLNVGLPSRRWEFNSPYPHKYTRQEILFM